MASGTFEVQGALELGKALEGLADKVRGSVIRKALRLAAWPIYAAAVRLVPEKSGKLADSIKVTTFWAKAKGVLGATIGTGAGHLFTGDTFYGGFVEFGHRIGKRDRAIERRIDRISKGRKSFGKARLSPIETDALRTEFGDARAGVPAYPFMRPAWDEKKETAKQIILSELKRGIEREAVKAAKAAGVK